MTTTGKFPMLKYTYESVKAPGLYFAGVLAHSLDWRKSAGGFIHGYRYTARTLYHHLEWKNHGVPWPSTSGDLINLPMTLQKRMNEGSGIYQMFTTFSDLAIVDKETATYIYLEEVPTMFLFRLPELTGHNFTKGRHMLVSMAMHYGANFSRPDSDIFAEDRVTTDPAIAHRSNFLHPVIRIFYGLPKEPLVQVPSSWENLFKPDGIHHVLEDFTTKFNCPTTHSLPLRQFLEHHFGTDMRHFLAKTCFQMALFSQFDGIGEMTQGCRHYLSSTPTYFNLS